MRIRKTLIFSILALGMIVALSAWAQEIVAPTFRSARPDVAASLPRHLDVPWPSWPCPSTGRMPMAPLRAALKGGATTLAALAVGATAAAGTTPGIDGTLAKPFTQEQVVSMMRDGFGDESGAKLIEQRGIDFAPSEDLYQTLKTSGASEAFLKALRAAKPPELASAKKPINQVQVFALLVGQVASHRVTMLVQQRGIDFEPTDDYLQEVRLAGGEDELIGALKSAKVTKPATVDQAAQARRTELRQHVARGSEFAKNGRYAEAEQEYRSRKGDWHACPYFLFSSLSQFWGSLHSTLSPVFPFGRNYFRTTPPSSFAGSEYRAFGCPSNRSIR